MMSDLAKAMTSEFISTTHYQRALFENNPFGLLVCDLDMFIVDANLAASNLFGKAVALLVGQRLSESLNKDGALVCKRIATAVRRCQAVENAEASLPGGVKVTIDVAPIQVRRQSLAWLMIRPSSKR